MRLTTKPFVGLLMGMPDMDIEVPLPGEAGATVEVRTGEFLAVRKAETTMGELDMSLKLLMSGQTEIAMFTRGWMNFLDMKL